MCWPKGKSDSCGTNRLGQLRAGPLMGTSALQQGQAPNYQTVRGRGWGGQGAGQGPTCQVQKSAMACRRE